MIRDIMLVLASIAFTIFVIKFFQPVRDYFLDNSKKEYTFKQDSLNWELLKKDTIIKNLISESSKYNSSIKTINNNLSILSRELVQLKRENINKYEQYTTDAYFEEMFKNDSIKPEEITVTIDSNYVFTGIQASHIRKIWSDKLNFELDVKFLSEKIRLVSDISDYQNSKIIYLEKDSELKSEIINVTNSKLNLITEKYNLSNTNEVDLQKRLEKANKKISRLEGVAYVGGATIAAILIKVLLLK